MMTTMALSMKDGLGNTWGIVVDELDVKVIRLSIDVTSFDSTKITPEYMEKIKRGCKSTYRSASYSVY